MSHWAALTSPSTLPWARTELLYNIDLDRGAEQEWGGQPVAAIRQPPEYSEGFNTNTNLNMWLALAGEATGS